MELGVWAPDVTEATPVLHRHLGLGETRWQWPQRLCGAEVGSANQDPEGPEGPGLLPRRASLFPKDYAVLPPAPYLLLSQSTRPITEISVAGVGDSPPQSFRGLPAGWPQTAAPSEGQPFR